jgi:hypothetical protein
MTEKASTDERVVSQTKEEIIKEAQRIEEATLFSAKEHFAAAHFWSAFHLWIGLPTTILAAAAAASAFLKSDKNVLAGMISVLVAVLSAVATFLNPNTRAAAHLKAGNRYDALHNKTRIFRTIECWGSDSDLVLTKTVKGLSEEKNKLNAESPQPPRWTYMKAKKGIEAGEADYVVDKNKEVPTR